MTTRNPFAKDLPDEADECAHTALSLIYRRERDEARCQFDAILAVNRQLLADILAQDTERLRLGSEVDRLTATLAERDATIERLWAQLNEATNVPAAPYDPAIECGCPKCAHYRQEAARVTGLKP